MDHTYSIEGMHCQSCVGKIENALKTIPEIKEVHVSLSPPKAEVKMGNHVDTSVLNTALHKVGDYSLSEKTALHDPVHTLAAEDNEESVFSVYYPLILISIYLLGGVFVRAIISKDFEPMPLMNNFMGGFFIIFSFFKMLNLKGFAEAYSTYDVIAKKYYNYGFVYPFIELILGILYLTASAPYLTNIVTIVVMGISSIGVIQALLKRSNIQCACLGTIFKLPMTKITLFEDLLMVGMAAMMLYVY